MTLPPSHSHHWLFATKRAAIRATVRCLLASVVWLLLCTASVATAATFSVAGTQLNLDLNTANEAVAIVSNGMSYMLTLTGSTWSGTNSANVTGNGTTTLTVTTAGLVAFDTINLTDSAAGTTATFTDSGVNPYSDTFNITLDHATAGTITFAGASSFTGSAGLTARTSHNIVFASGSSLDTEIGNLVLAANQQAVATSGDFIGILLDAATVTGQGLVTVQGRGGNSGAAQYGVRLQNGAVLTGSEFPPLTVTGTGGTAAGNFHAGVSVVGADTQITSIGGSVRVTGQGGGTGSTGSNWGVVVATGAQISANGAGGVIVTGTGGAGSGTSDFGVYVTGANTRITAADAAVSVTGTGTATSAAIVLEDSGAIITASSFAPILITADSIAITSPGAIAGTDLVTIQPRTAGTLINLGGADVLSGPPFTLGLTDAELDQVTAGTLEIGNLSSGPLTVSADLTWPARTAVELISGSDVVLSGGQVNTNGGRLLLDPGLSPAAVKPTHAATDATASIVSFGSDLNINITGTTVDTQYSQLNVAGTVNLTNVDLVLTGGYVAQLGDVFTIVSATSVTGTFTGLPAGATLAFNTRTLEINYTPTTVTLAVTAVPVELQSFEVE